MNKGLVNLKQIHLLAGAPKYCTPSQWLRLPSSQFILSRCIERLDLPKDALIISRRGTQGGTWAHKEIAISYAQYLQLNIQNNEELSAILTG